MRFKNIEYELKDNHLRLCAEYDGNVLVAVELSKGRLAEMFPKEFAAVRPIHYNPIEYVETGGEVSLEFWVDEYMSPKRANELFGNASIDEIVEVVTP